MIFFINRVKRYQVQKPNLNLNPTRQEPNIKREAYLRDFMYKNDPKLLTNLYRPLFNFYSQ